MFFFFKQKTAYEMRISDWSSDVCSSDLDDDTYADLHARFGYMFEAVPLSPPHHAPPLVRRPFGEGRHETAGVTVEAFRQDHGNSGESLGLIFGGRFAYSTDVHALSDAQLDRLAALQLDTWIVDCLREEPNTAHGNLALSLAWIAG